MHVDMPDLVFCSVTFIGSGIDHLCISDLLVTRTQLNPLVFSICGFIQYVLVLFCSLRGLGVFSMTGIASVEMQYMKSGKLY